MINRTLVNIRAYPYRFFEASLPILHLNFFLKRYVADGVSLLAELALEFLTTENNGSRHHSDFERICLRLIFEHLNLTLQSSAIVIPRTLKVVVHLLNVGHEVGKVGSLHHQRPVFLNQAALNTLRLPQCTIGAEFRHKITSQIFFSARRLADSLRN